MDKESFTRLALERQRTLYRIALSYTASAADAEDAVQEALLRAWDKRHTLREEQYFGTWLTRILINECKGLLKRRRRAAGSEALPEIPVPPVDEAALALREAMFALPESLRVPLVLTVVEGYTLRETAAMLRLPLGTVKTRVVRAKKRLKEEVGEHA